LVETISLQTDFITEIATVVVIITVIIVAATRTIAIAAAFGHIATPTGLR
jgi:hypothetical protein